MAFLEIERLNIQLPRRDKDGRWQGAIRESGFSDRLQKSSSTVSVVIVF